MTTTTAPPRQLEHAHGTAHPHHVQALPGTLGQSRFWAPLWETYAHAPSIALCRVPELEYAAMLNVTARVLDHCCGDGVFAGLAWPGKVLTAGCDIDAKACGKAERSGMYARVDGCDAAKRLPYDDASFDTVFNNSSLEHIENLDSALAEIARVLAPGGRLVFNLLSRRFYDWWPMSAASRDEYRRIQPIHHALDLNEWRERLAAVGLEAGTVRGYFNRRTSQALARLDYGFCRHYLIRKTNLLVRSFRWFPDMMLGLWQKRLADEPWITDPDAGGGYFIEAVKRGGRS